MIRKHTYGIEKQRKDTRVSSLLASVLLTALIITLISSVVFAVTQTELDDLVNRLANVRDRALSDAIGNAKSKERLSQIATSPAFLAAEATQPALRDLLNKRLAEDLPATEDEAKKSLMQKAGQYGLGSLGVLAVLALGFVGYKKGWFKKITGRDAESLLIELIKKLINVKEEVKKDTQHIHSQLTEEQTTFDECRNLVAQITEHVKETIGEEKELANEVERSSKINEKLQILRAHNFAEKNAAIKATEHLNEGVNDIARIRVEKEEVFAAMNNVKSVHEAFRKADDGLQMLQNVDLTEAGVLDRLQQHFDETIADFQALETACEGIHLSLNSEIDELIRLERGEANYQAILLDIRRLRDNAIKLNALFAKKVQTFKDLVKKFRELKLDVSELSGKEMAKLQEYLELAKREWATQQPSYERIVYYASIVKKNAILLGLTELSDEAKKIVKDAMPRLIEAREKTVKELVERIEELVKTAEREKIGEALKLLQRVMISEVDLKDVKIKEQIQKLRVDVLGKLLDHAERQLQNEQIGEVKVMADLVERVSRVEGHALHEDHKKRIDKLRGALDEYDAAKFKEMFDRIVANNAYRTVQEIEIAKKTIRVFIRAGKDAAEKKANLAYVQQKLSEEGQGQHLTAEVIAKDLEAFTLQEPWADLAVNLAAKIKSGEVLSDERRKALEDMIAQLDKDIQKANLVKILKLARNWSDEKAGLRELWQSLAAEEVTA
ncbi:hypothetical protein HY772_03955 [Candidatus Woesearchaeota archaeon]|nr:hypothetical protein [Candidatus Woesearchaeota archaeon]